MDVAVGETGARRRKRQRVSTSTPPSSDAPKVARRQVRPKKQLHEDTSSQGHHRQVSYHSPNNQHPYWQALLFAPGLGGCRMRLVRTESFSCFLHGHNEAMAKAHGFRDSAHYAAACPTAADLEASARATKRLRVLASAHLCVRLDVDALAPKFASCQLRASGGPLIITRRSPECTIKLFEDGSVTCAGAASVEEARLALKQVARRCLTTGASVKFRMFKVTAIDGEFRVPLRVNSGLSRSRIGGILAWSASNVREWTPNCNECLRTCTLAGRCPYMVSRASRTSTRQLNIWHPFLSGIGRHCYCFLVEY